MKNKRSIFDRIFNWTTFLVWIVSWFACIWIREYREALFWTGFFSLFLGIITNKPESR